MVKIKSLPILKQWVDLCGFYCSLSISISEVRTPNINTNIAEEDNITHPITFFTAWLLTPYVKSISPARLC